MEQYIDIGEFSQNPVKNSLNAFQYYLSNDTRFDINYLSISQINLQDSYFASSFGQETYNYTKIRNFYISNG